MAKRKTKIAVPTPEPFGVPVVPDQFRAALDKEPANIAIRYGISDWFGERDRPHEAEAWNWFAQTNKTPVLMTEALARTVNDALGHKIRGYTEAYVAPKAYVALKRKKLWRWFGAGWSGTPLEAAALGPVINALTLTHSRATAADAMAALVAVRVTDNRENRLETGRLGWHLSTLVPRTDGTRPEPLPEGDEGPGRFTIEGVFSTFRRYGIAYVQLDFAGGHDSGGVDSVAAYEPLDYEIANPFAEYRGPILWDAERKAHVPARDPSVTEMIAEILEAPVYAQYYSFNNEPMVDGTLTWSADSGLVTMSSTETFSEYQVDEDGNEIEDDEPDERVEAIEMQFYNHPNYW